MSLSSELLFERIEALKKKPFDELVLMPPKQEETVSCSDGLTTLAVWKDDVGESELRLVVQAYQPGILGIGKMQASGFRVTPKEIKELDDDELAEFS